MSETSVPTSVPTSEPPCECPGPGFCPRYRINQDEYAHAVCANKPLPGRTVTAAKSEAYRKKWRLDLILRPGRGDAPPPMTPPEPPPRRRAARRSPDQVEDYPPGYVPDYPPERVEAPREGGPGTELRKLIKSLGLTGERGCLCKAVAGEMDALGVGGCRREADRFVTHLRKQQSKLGWGDKLRAAANFPLELVGSVNPIDPAPGLFSEALRRAETGGGV